MKRSWSGFAGVLMLSGCSGASAPVVTAQPTTREYAAPFDAAWVVLVEVLASRSLSIGTIEKESGLIVTDFVRIDLERLCAMSLDRPGFRNLWTEGRFKLNVHASPSGDPSTRLRITCHLEGFHNMAKEWTVARSNGALENELLDAVAAALGGPGHE